MAFIIMSLLCIAGGGITGLLWIADGYMGLFCIAKGFIAFVPIVGGIDWVASSCPVLLALCGLWDGVRINDGLS